MEMAQCFMFESKMPKQFWAEAVITSTYIHNCNYSKTIENKTVWVWHQHKPFLEHVEVFDSACYLYVFEENINKFKKRARVCVTEVAKDFWVYNIET